MALDFPSNPIDGQISGNYQWSSTSGAWKAIASSPQVAVASSTAPTSPTNGSIWFNTNDGTYFSYYDDGTSKQWVEMMSAGIPASPVTVPNGGTGVSSFANANGYVKVGSTGTSALTSQSGIPGSHITSGGLFKRVLGQAIWNGSAVYFGTSYADLANSSVTFTSAGTQVKVSFRISVMNGASGATRQWSAKCVTSAGVLLGKEFTNIPSTYNTSTDVNQIVHSFLWTPTAGSQTIKLQTLASATPAVGVIDLELTVEDTF